MHDAGFRLKCLVNEACLMGCPNSFNHNLSIAMGRRPVLLSCCQNGVADLFRANWILPRWQKHYDEMVDIYKIAGRNVAGNYPFKTLDAYLAEDDSMPLAELMISGTVLFATHMLPGEILRRQAPDLRMCGLRALRPLREDPFGNHPGGISGTVPIQDQGDIVSGIIKNLL